MSKNRRRSLHFDSLEGKVLLSASSAKADHHPKPTPFVLNGSVSGLPYGQPGVGGFTETSFPVSGHAGSMKNVTGAFQLAEPFIPAGKLPDLAGAKLTLENTKGTLELAITQPKKGHYRFTVASGTDAYAKDSGSGTIAISSPRFGVNFVIKLHTTAPTKG